MSLRPDFESRWLWVVGVGQSFVLAAFFMQDIFAPGYLLHNDFITPLRYTPTFLARFLNAWDPVVGGFSYSMPKLVIQFWVAAFAALGVSTALLYKLIVVFILGLLGATMFYLVFRLSTRLTTEWRAYAAATLASLLIMTNPWTLNKIHHHFWLVLGVAMLPLIYLLYLRALDGRGGLGTLLALSGLFVVEATQPHSLFIYAIPVLVFTAAVFLLAAPSLARLRRTLTVTAKLFVVAVLVNMFWLLPLGLFFTNNSPTPGGYLLTVENVLSLSRKSEILRATHLRSGLGMKGLIAPGYAASYRTGIPLLNRLWPVMGAGIIGFSLLGLVVDRVRERRARLVFAGLAVVSLTLLTGTQPPLGDLYRRAALELPMGWMLRDPFKFGGLFIFALSGLFGVSVAVVLSKLHGIGSGRSQFRRLRGWPVEIHVKSVERRLPDTPLSGTAPSAMFVAVLLVATSFHGWPMLTGDVNDHFEPTEVPEDYQETLDYLGSNVENSRVLWLPNVQFSITDPRVFRYSWPEGLAKYHIRGSKFLEFSTPAPVMPQNPTNKRLLDWLHEKLRRDTVERPSVPLQAAGVGYVAFHTDVNDPTRASEILPRIKADPAITEVFRRGDIHVLKVQNASMMQAGPAVETYDLDNFDTLYQTDGTVQPGDPPATLTFQSNVSERDAVVSSGNAPPKYLPVGVTAAPFDYTANHAPNRVWSKAQVHDPWQGRWHRYLVQRGINTWQTDFGEGMAFTWASERIRPGVTSTAEDRLGQWRFVGYNVPPGWENLDSEQSVNVTDGHLEIALDESSYGWKRVASPPINVTTGTTYQFTFDVVGIDAHAVHAKIAEYNAAGRLIHIERVTDLGSGNFSRSGVAATYVPKMNATESVRLQVWHGHQTDKPLPNVVHLDNVRAYNASDIVQGPTLDMNVSVDDPGEYRLVGRYLASEDGGRIRIGLDGEEFTVGTEASFNRFVWDHIATRNLSAGAHTISVENVEGFNGVNMVKLVPESEFQANLDRLETELQDKSVAYHLDAAQDLRRENTAAVSPRRDGRERPALSLDTEGEIWRTVDVLKSGEYAVSIRGSGSFVARIGGQTFPFNGSVGTELNYGTVALPQGEHRLSVTPIGRSVGLRSFENLSGLSDANGPYTVSRSVVADRGEYSVRVDTNTTERTWSWVYTDPMNVTPGESYSVSANLRYRNTNQSHVVVQGYNQNAGNWERLGFVSTGRVGTSNWETYQTLVDVPESVDRLRFALNAGWVYDESEPTASTWFDDVSVRGVANNTVQEVTLTNSPSGQSLDELVHADGENESATVLDYEQVSPTKYRVQVDADQPYMLSFAEGYDPLWVAEVQTPDGVRTYDSTEINSMMNGFWIEQTGEYTVTIRYRGQSWLRTGTIISALSVVGCLGLVAFGRRRWHEGPRAQRLRARLDPHFQRASDRLHDGRQRLRERLGPRLQQARERASAWSRQARERASPIFRQARERASPTLRQGRDRLADWTQKGRSRLASWLERARERVRTLLERRRP